MPLKLPDQHRHPQLFYAPLTQRGQRTAEPDRASLDFALGAVNRLLDAIGSEVVREAA